MKLRTFSYVTGNLAMLFCQVSIHVSLLQHILIFFLTDLLDCGGDSLLVCVLQISSALWLAFLNTLFLSTEFLI